jgi:hypothetical protein
MTFNLLDLVSDSKLATKKENKKKLHKLLDKYGSVEEIERNGDLRDGFELDFARIDGALDEVLEERQLGYRESMSNDSDTLQSNEKQSNTLLPDDEDFSLEGLTLSDRQRKVIDKLDMNTQLTVIRALREQQGVEKPKAKKETSPSELDVLQEKVAKANREIKMADNEYSETRSDTKVVKERDDNKLEINSVSLEKAKNLGIYEENNKFDLLIESVFYEEGGYEDNSDKIDQPTNIGIIQSTLNNFNKAHPNLKIDKPLNQISKDDARLIYKLDFYDHYNLDAVDDFGNSKILLHMFVMLQPNTALNLLHKSLNDFGYPCKKLLTKQMIPMLNKINKDEMSDEFSKLLKLNYTNHLKKSPNAKKYKGWFPRIERL